MKRQTILATNFEEYELVDTKLDDGWVLDPTLTDGKPYRLENVTVWPLVLYESEDEKPKPVSELKVGEFDDVGSLRDVPNADVDGLLKDGYVIYQIFSKNTILLKRSPKALTEGS